MRVRRWRPPTRVKNDELVPAAVSGGLTNSEELWFAVKSGPTYNQMMRALGPLSFKCTDPARRVGEYRTKPNVPSQPD